LNKFKRLNQVTASTDKKANKMAVNWGSNPGAGVKIMSFQREKKPLFSKKTFEYYAAIIL